MKTRHYLTIVMQLLSGCARPDLVQNPGVVCLWQPSTSAAQTGFSISDAETFVF